MSFAELVLHISGEFDGDKNAISANIAKIIIAYEENKEYIHQLLPKETAWNLIPRSRFYFPIYEIS